MAKNVPSLFEQWHQVRTRVSTHWRGELPVREVLTHCVALVFFPVTIGLIVAIIRMLMSQEVEGVSNTALIYGSSGLSLLAGGWWCKGMFATSNRLLSDNSFLAGVMVFLLACLTTWWLLATCSFQWVRNFSHDLTSSKAKIFDAEGWEQKPVQVVALPELHRLSVTGDIGVGSATALATALAANPDIHLVELESLGGFVREADLMVYILQKRGMDTLARGKCISACTEVFLAGKRRFVGPNARFGFHQSGHDGRAHDTVWNMPEYESSIFFRAQGVDQRFADQALNTSYYSLWKPNVLDVKQSGFATAWWSDRPKEYE